MNIRCFFLREHTLRRQDLHDIYLQHMKPLFDMF